MWGVPNKLRQCLPEKAVELSKCSLTANAPRLALSSSANTVLDCAAFLRRLAEKSKAYTQNS